MPALANSRHEAFAQARFRGMSAPAAHTAAGYTGACTNACRLARHPTIRARIAELNAAVEKEIFYEKVNALRDLVAIIGAAPDEGGPKNRLSIMRMGKTGPYHVFPDKLRALDRLAKLMGWDKLPDPNSSTDDSLTSVLEFVRRRK